MENNIQNELIDETNQVTNERPVFLKVLCILTFVGSGLALFSGIWTVLQADSLENFEALAANPDLDIFGILDIDFEEFSKWNFYSGLATIFGSLAGLTGGLLMWNLKKVGYPIYIAAWVIPMIIGFMSISHVMPSAMQGIGIATQVVSMLFMAAFVIMYGVNLKHMK